MYILAVYYNTSTNVVESWEFVDDSVALSGDHITVDIVDVPDDFEDHWMDFTVVGGNLITPGAFTTNTTQQTPVNLDYPPSLIRGNSMGLFRNL